MAPTKIVCEIRAPEFVFFRGSSEDTRGLPITVKAQVCVTTPDNIMSNYVQLYLHARRRTVYIERDNEELRLPQNSNFLHQEFRQKVKGIPKGSHTYDFEFTLPGHTPETVIGIDDDTFCMYELHAVVDRALYSDVLRKKHLRVIRTLPAESTMLRDPLTAGEICESMNLQYTVSVSSQAVAFGDIIKTMIHISSLSEKDEHEPTDCELYFTEKRETWCFNRKTITRVHIASARIPFSWGKQSKDPATGLTCWECPANLQLPKSLSACRQNAATPNIIITHALMVKIRSKKAEDGSVTEVSSRFHMHIFISEYMPVGINDAVGAAEVPTGGGEHGYDSIMESLQEGPPRYEGHANDLRLGELYEGLNESVLNSPLTRSGQATPAFVASRRASSDALFIQAATGAQPLPQALGERLRELQSRGQELQEPIPVGYADSARRTRAVTDHRRSLAGPGSGSSNGPMGVAILPRANSAYNMSELQRIESYETAVRTPARVTSGSFPPSYDESNSASSSPNKSRSPPVRKA